MKYTLLGIKKFLAEKYKTEISGLEPIGQGEWSKAYYFAVNNQSKVIRISRLDEDFKRDKFAWELASGQIPIPEIEEIGKIEDDFYAISSRIDGIIDRDKGVIVRSSNLNSWVDRNIKDLLAKRYNSEVIVEHDVVLAGLSESSRLDLSGNYLFVIWGTGFGGVLVEKNIDGEVKTTQIEIGHQIIDWNGLQCNCGQKGCLEAYIGGGQYKKNHLQRLSDLMNDREWDDIINKASLGLCNSMVHLSTRNIIMDGGVIAKQTWLINEINKKITSILKVTDCPKISLASHLGDSAIYGGLGLIKKKLPVCSG